MIFGYSRVSTPVQNLDRQNDALTKYGCEEIISEKVSGVKKEREGLKRLKDKVRAGDTIVVESFSRLGRSMRDLLELVEYFKEKGVVLISLKESFDTNTVQGKLMLTMFSAFAEFERDLTRQRSLEGLAAARARGKVGGRPALSDKKIETALTLYDSMKYTIQEITGMTGIAQSSLYKYIHLRDKAQ